MSVLYLTEPRGTLRLQAGALVVTREADDGPGPRRQTLLTLPPHQVEVAALVGDVHITADATRFCLERGIALAWFSSGGRLLGRVVPLAARCADLRLAQYADAYQRSAALARARSVVSAKLSNAVEVLADLFSNYPKSPQTPDSRALRDLADRAVVAPDRATLLGLEGIGARQYFQGLADACRGELTFPGRLQHPPPDPFNALLSLGYVLLGNRLASLLEARGLDPALGFFHEIRPGRSSLAQDLLEEFRHPVVDRFVVRTANLRIFLPRHFTPDDERPGGVRLTGEAFKRFLSEWERFLARPLRDEDETVPHDVPTLLRRQVERLAVDLRGGVPYRPLVYRGHD